MSFLGEIRRRKVFQVAAVYAVVAWLIIQIVGEVSEPLNLPDWLDTVVIVLLAVGFPVAVILAWAFDLTPEGVVRDRGDVTPQTGRRGIEYVLIALVIVALGWLVYRVEFDAGGVADGQRDGRLPNSVAMLPCDNLSDDPEDAFFAAGIHESTLNQLAKIRDINLIARSTVMQYADNRPPIPEIAASLNVEMVMECSVRYANNEVLITVQLIDGITGTHIDSEEYPGDLTDMFAIQGEIAERIATALQAELLPEERQRIQKVQTGSPAALALYLQASNIQITPGGFGPRDELHRLLDRAIELDPGFARAHALKAYDYSRAIIRARRTDDPDTSELEHEALKHIGIAISLNPDESLSYSALAELHRNNWRIMEAHGAYEKALELAPNENSTFQGLSFLSTFFGEYDRAIEFGIRSHELNQLDYSHGRAYLTAGNFDAAYHAWNAAQQLEPSNPYGYYYQAVTEWHRGNKNSAMINAEKADELLASQFNSQDLSPFGIVRLIHIYGILERPEDAQKLFSRLEQLSVSFHISASSRAISYLGIRDLGQAKSWLERVDEERNPEDALSTFTIIITNRHHDPVLERPDFVELRNRLRERR